MTFNPKSLRAKQIDAFAKFIRARENARENKELGSKHHLDPIIRKYRFCNVRRNDDRVTRFVQSWAFDAMGWRADRDLWFAFVVARLFNNEETLRAIEKYVLPYKPLPMVKVLKQRANDGHKNFNAAYIVSTNGRAMNKVDYVVNYILTPLWKSHGFISDMIEGADTLSDVHQLLMEYNGMASFMAAQVVADLKYAQPHRWEDFTTFAASGPGSKRGLNRVLGLDKDAPMSEATFRDTLSALRDSVNLRLGMSAITAQDIQNCLCEYDKYERARTGDGEPKQLYKPKEK